MMISSTAKVEIAPVTILRPPNLSNRMPPTTLPSSMPLYCSNSTSEATVNGTPNVSLMYVMVSGHRKASPSDETTMHSAIIQMTRGYSRKDASINVSTSFLSFHHVRIECNMNLLY